MSTGRYESYPPRTVLAEAVFCGYHPTWGLSYQSCRFCKGSAYQSPGPNGNPGLWKYSIRHYICGRCREKGMKNPVGRMSK